MCTWTYTFDNNPVNWVDPWGLKQTPVEPLYIMQNENWKDEYLKDDPDHGTIGSAGCAVTASANLISTGGEEAVNPSQVNEKYVDKGNMQWGALGSAYGYTVDVSNNYNQAPLTHEVITAQENDSEYEYRTLVNVNYDHNKGPHWVGVQGIETIDGVDYIKISVSSNNDYDIAADKPRGKQGWRKEGDNIYVPTSETKGYINFVKKKNK